jgi:two-component system sensor histidine kinase/response regulator
MSAESKSILAATGPVRTGRTSQPLRVLVADDHPVNLRLVAEILRERGHQPTLADTGFEALRLFRNATFDAILMDGQMPEMDGYAAAREIRRIEQFAGGRIAIIAVTANVGPQERQICLDAGMDDYIAKPIDPDILLDCLESAVGGTGRVRGGTAGTTGPMPLARHADPAPEPEPERIGGALVFNRIAALERVRGKHRFLRQLTEMFLAELPKVLDAIGTAAAANNTVQLESLAHRLRGAAMTVGGEALAAVATALEKSAGWGGAANVPCLVSQLYTSAAQLCSALEHFAAEPIGPAGHANAQGPSS